MLIVVQILLLVAWFLLPAAAILPVWVVFLPLFILAGLFLFPFVVAGLGLLVVAVMMLIDWVRGR